MTSADRSLEQPELLDDPGAAEELGAEAVRAVNRLTLASPSPGRPGWGDVGDLYRVLAELRVLAERLPQAVEQLCRHLERPCREGVSYRSDGGTRDGPEVLVATAAAALASAKTCARRVGDELTVSQSAVAHLSSVIDRDRRSPTASG